MPKRLKEHAHKTSGKDFWHRAVAFASSKGALSRGHCLWLENRLIKKAKEIGRCSLENGDSGNEAKLTLSEEADCNFYLEKIYQILPLAGVQAFEKKVDQLTKAEDRFSFQQHATLLNSDIDAPNTIVVPARDDGFKRVFIGENCWHAVRISSDRISDLKYIAGYRVGKIRAVTHYAEIKEILPYGDEGKYKIVFKGAAEELDKPIRYKSGHDSSLQASRYTRYEKLFEAKNLTQLFDLTDD